MTVYEFDKVVDEFLRSTAFKEVTGIAQEGAKLETELSKKARVVMAIDPDATNILVANAKEARPILDQALGWVGKISARQFFGSIHNLEREIENFHEGLSTDEANFAVLHQIAVQVSDFADEFDRFATYRNHESTYRFLLECKALYLQINTFTNTLSSTREILLPQGTIKAGEGESSIDILLSGSQDLEIIAVKLTALKNVYSELCRVFGVSEADYPLRALKIETGSLWMQILGHTGVITFFVTSLGAAATYLYRNYTKDGKLTMIPKRVQELEAIIGLEAKLRESGINTDELKESIQKASVTISNEFNQLLAGEPKVVINEQIYSIGQAVDARMIGEGRRLMLEDGRAESSEDDGKEGG